MHTHTVQYLSQFVADRNIFYWNTKQIVHISGRSASYYCHSETSVWRLLIACTNVQCMCMNMTSSTDHDIIQNRHPHGVGLLWWRPTPCLLSQTEKYILLWQECVDGDTTEAIKTSTVFTLWETLIPTVTKSQHVSVHSLTDCDSYSDKDQSYSIFTLRRMRIISWQTSAQHLFSDEIRLL